MEDGFSGNQFGHSENRLGSATAGVYHVLLPDGRVQTVEYTVDSYAGYKATVNYQGGYQELVSNPVNGEYSKLLQMPLMPVNTPVNAMYHLVSSGQKVEERIPVPNILDPAHTQLSSAKYSRDSQIYQVASSHQQPIFLPLPSNSIDDHSSYRPVMYKPKSYKPAPVQTNHQIHNLLIRPSPHHKVITDPHVRPLAPPEHRKTDKSVTSDPFLASEEELKGKDFSCPFWYPLKRKIVKGYRKKV